jgi:hypothetical protein
MFEFRKEFFLLLKGFGMHTTATPIQFHWMLQVEHLVIDEIFHAINRHLCAIEDAADDNRIVSGVIMTEALP